MVGLFATKKCVLMKKFLATDFTDYTVLVSHEDTKAQKGTRGHNNFRHRFTP
jgi:hypothetical protein